ncbi:MAG TPA: DUF1330 domain-containing protein [Cellvibrionaceae bacterium]
MKVLAIIETMVINPSWIEEYTKNVTPIVLRYGGKYITRSSNIELIEGAEKPHFSVVAEFPSKERAVEFYNSQEYEPYRKSRLIGSASKFLLVNVENSAA